MAFVPLSQNVIFLLSFTTLPYRFSILFSNQKREKKTLLSSPSVSFAPSRLSVSCSPNTTSMGRVPVAAATSHWFSLRHPAEAATLSESVKHGESSGDLDARKFGKQEVKCSLDGSNEEKTEGLSACEGGGQLTTSRSCAAHPTKILQIKLPKYLTSYCHLINVILIFLERQHLQLAE
ncbi:hypothetical protein ACSBR2_020133 [Camellia fascicularis]